MRNYFRKKVLTIFSTLKETPSRTRGDSCAEGTKIGEINKEANK